MLRTSGFSALSTACAVIVLALASTSCASGGALLMAAAMMAPSPSAALVDIMASTDDAMMTVQPCSNVDVYFAESMIAHHQGAITMAEWELKYGHNEQLLNISASIVTTQTAQVEELQGILAGLPMPADCMSAPMPAPEMGAAPTALSPTASAMRDSMAGMADGTMTTSSMSGMDMGSMPGMDMGSMDMGMSMPPATATLNGIPDRDFAIEMKVHHQAAIEMANVELKYGTSKPLLELAQQIIDAQTMEIEDFTAILAQDYATE